MGAVAVYVGLRPQHWGKHGILYKRAGGPAGLVAASEHNRRAITWYLA